MWVVLDLYGPIRSVSIVSSTRLEESEGTQPPSPTSDTGSEGEEENEGEEQSLGVRLPQRFLVTWEEGCGQLGRPRWISLPILD